MPIGETHGPGRVAAVATEIGLAARLQNDDFGTLLNGRQSSAQPGIAGADYGDAGHGNRLEHRFKGLQVGMAQVGSLGSAGLRMGLAEMLGFRPGDEGLTAFPRRCGRRRARGRRLPGL